MGRGPGRRFRPITPEHLVAELVDKIVARSDPTTVRVLLDGAPATGVHELADAMAARLRTLGRPPLVVRAEQFWRDASLRLEWGHHDEQSYYESWLDVAALRREVFGPLGPDGDGTWLPSLRDPATNRSTRVSRAPAPHGAVLLLSGALLLVHPLPADLVVHAAASPAALARRTPESDAWTLPVYALYDREVKPAQRADLVIRVEDPRHPAISP